MNPMGPLPAERRALLTMVRIEPSVGEEAPGYTSVMSTTRNGRNELTSSKHSAEPSINSDNVINAIRADIRKASCHLRVVVPICTVGWVIVLEVRLHSLLLVLGQWEDIREATSRVDHAFCSLFRLCNCSVGCYLSSADRGHIGTGSRETWVENAVVGSWGCVVSCGRIDTLSAVAGDAVVT
jgi:hypothetical protein